MSAIEHGSGAALSALLDRHRLAIAASLIDHARTVDEIVTASGLARPVVLQALGVLRQTGLVEQTGDGYTMPVERLVVLERIALEFDLGRRYDEAEVDVVLHTFHLDVATLRRHLIDERLLSRTRENGITRYLRSGGRIGSIS